MTAISDLFQKPVDRPIDGVIKADDTQSLRLEVEEYVLTGEVQTRLSKFVEAYNNYAGANGVWVSGFFGSGKSHLLKMMSLLLENGDLDGARVADLFLPKCKDDRLLRAGIERAVAVPSQSILFNIDQKADVISKKEADALLSVFVKVFDDACGYYGKQGHIAQFERDLDKRSKLADFRAAFEDVAGIPWEVGREQAVLEESNVAAAYAQVMDLGGADASGVLERYRSQYSMSIEDFADLVNDYIERQGDDFRLNFFVDEVGQYVADNIKLMTNLQTVAESLATKCKGRAWIVVTAQDDMDTVVGDRTSGQTNDFTKIQARFDTRMKLTSQDVSEVIQERLLSKRDDVVDELKALHDRWSSSFNTLLEFGDGSKTYRNYSSAGHFVSVYPFVPYQFGLFQASIQQLSAHNAFEGRHSSVGERSMLAVFQQVAKQIAVDEVGQLATFDLMFEGVRTTLTSSVQQSILQAEQNLTDDFAVRVLKSLFMVKYLRDFKATARNVVILMLERLDQDVVELRARVERALDLLDAQTYVQRNGDVYEFLTDEEKDIEEEIKSTQIEVDDLRRDLSDLFFNDLLGGMRKIRSESAKRDFEFTRRVDGTMTDSRDRELGIRIVSPLADEDRSQVIANSLDSSDLWVRLGQSTRFVRDLEAYRRTEKYLKQAITASQTESVTRILNEKRDQNRQRRSDLRVGLGQLIREGDLVVRGSVPDPGGVEPVTRITRAFDDLVDGVYPNLKMLRGETYDNASVRSVLDSAAATISGIGASTAAESEVLTAVVRIKATGIRVTVKGLIDQFTVKPYGWDIAAVVYHVARLAAAGRVDIREDSNLIEGLTLYEALIDSSRRTGLIIEAQSDFSAAQVGGLASFAEDFFGTSADRSDPKATAQSVKERLGVRLDELSSIVTATTSYPFHSELTAAVQELREVTGKQYDYYLTDFHDRHDRLVELQRDTFEPVQRFFGVEGASRQRDIFDAANAFLDTNRNNLSHLEDGSTGPLEALLADPGCLQGDGIRRIKSEHSTLVRDVAAILGQTVAEANSEIDALWERLSSSDEFRGLEGAERFESAFVGVRGRVDSSDQIAVVRDLVRRFESEDYPRLLVELLNPAPADGQSETADVVDTGGVDREGAPASATIVSLGDISPGYPRLVISSVGEVDEYLDALRVAMCAAIEGGGRIRP